MMALVVPSIPDEGHAADGLLVLLHLVDRKTLRTHPIKESRYSGVLATFARSTSRQDLSRSDREDLVNDSAELKLSSVPFEQPCDGRRCHRRPSQGLPERRRAPDQSDGMRRSASMAGRVARAYDSASAIARLISGWRAAAASASSSPSASISSVARSKTATCFSGTCRRIATTSARSAPLVPMRLANV